MSKISDYILPIGILAAIAIIIYVIYNKLTDNPIAQAAGAVGGTVERVISDIPKLNQPVIPTTPGYAPAPTPINYGIPITGVPGFLEFAETPTGGEGSPTPSFGAFLFPPLGLLDIAKGRLPTETAQETVLTKKEVAQAINQMDATYKKYYPSPKINVNATPTTAALLTNTNKLQTPTVQIQAYNIAPKVVKVGNAFKKVM